jgi:hypothetical protein
MPPLHGDMQGARAIVEALGQTRGMAGPRVTLVGKPGCHLCDEARPVVAAACADAGLEWAEVSILDDPGLADSYAEQIPVVLIDGRVHDYWRVDALRLATALAEASQISD